MPDVLIKCSVCGAVLDEEDLFCPNCGTEAPIAGSLTPSTDHGPRTTNHEQGTNDQGPRTNNQGQLTAPAAPITHLTTCNFTCRGCGASMSYDASAQTLRCPFCGSENLEKKPDAKEIAADGVVPFATSQDQAIASMRQWLGQGFWRPGDLAAQAAVVGMRSVYIPYWVFEAETQTYWAADTSHTPSGARASWYPMTGDHQGEYSGLLVGASSALTPAETNSLCPFDLSTAVPPEKVALQNVIYERFTVPRKYARPLARQGLEACEADACQQYVPGKCRNMKVNVRITNLNGRPMLLPVWIMAYRYREQVFRFIVNGQTGKSTGQAPVSYRKIGMAVAIAAIIFALILFWLFVVGGGFHHRANSWDGSYNAPAKIKVATATTEHPTMNYSHSCLITG
jgi:predicted RNA-binding Zn-ribbon protein involved in translation (DUF1610 family)